MFQLIRPNLGFSRIKYWGYKSTVEDSNGNVTKLTGKDTKDNMKDIEGTESEGLGLWKSENGLLNGLKISGVS